MSPRKALQIICGVLIAWIAAVLPASSATRNIVLLYDERLEVPGLATIDADLVRTLTSSSPEKIEVYREPMDLSRFGSNGYETLLRDFLRVKYVEKKIDVAVAIVDPALNFLLRFGDDIFPGTPIIFCGVDRKELGDRALPRHARGVLLKREFAPTLEIALRLHPETKHIVVAAGTSEFDVRVLDQAKEEFRAYEKRVSFTYLTALPLKQLLMKVSALPPETIVLFTTLFQDGVGEPFITHDVVSRVSEAANAPTYGFLDQYLDRGIVGGSLYSSAVHGTEAASLILEVLSGTSPSGPQLLEPSANKVRFDWRQMQRWGISDTQLPEGSEIFFRELTAWDRYRWQLTGILAALLLQMSLIVGLLVERYRRQRAERQSRSRMLQLIHLNRSAAAGAMSASFAHELSQPLGAIAINADTAIQLFDEGVREASQLKEALGDIQHANQHALQIMQHMRGLLKRRDTVEFQSFDVNKVVADALHILSAEAQRRGVILDANCTSERLPVLADAVQLQQVILNLALNGMDAMSDTQDRRTMIIGTTLVKNCRVEVSVSDTGKGIPKGELSKVFETFYTTKPQGTGLGLSIARSIVESYGGTIWAEHRPGGGTIFRFNLSLAH